MYDNIKSFEDLPKILAVDFDGTLVTDKWPEIGKPNKSLFDLLKYLREEKGIKVILWTSRNYSDKYGDLLEDSVEFCKEQGLEFDAINENIPEVIHLTGEDTRKVYADIYIDDKGIPAFQHPLYWLENLGLSWIEMPNNLVMYA